MTRAAWLALAVIFVACSPSKGPEAGSQTNWLVVCDSSEECGALECLCGVCTAACESDATCAGFEDAACVPVRGDGSVMSCEGQAPEQSLCLPRTDDPALEVVIDTDERHQSLIGFGASLAYADDAIVAHARKEELYDLAFEGAGLDVIRLRNRYESADNAAIDPAREIIAAAAERIGRAPTLFMTSGTPPAALKASGERTCAGNPETCTLSSRPGGGFDYEGFARYWRESLDAYASAGVSPDYVSIQNNPNWVPLEDYPGEGCRFLPEEGMTQVTVGDAPPIEVAYPGYREAFLAVHDALESLQNAPQLAAPEATGVSGVSAYATALDASFVGAVALHLYGIDPSAVDVAALQAVHDVATQLDRPLLQTEMQAGGLDTAILVHHALATAGASAYLQNNLVAVATDEAEIALFLMTEGVLEAQLPYYALLHFAKHTEPGWVRVGATSEASELLSSAWHSPDDNALTVVLINPGAEELEAQLSLPAPVAASFARSEIIRTVFDGTERAAPQGELPADGRVLIPPRSVVTVALTQP